MTGPRTEAGRLAANIRQQVAIGADQQTREAVLRVLDRIILAIEQEAATLDRIAPDGLEPVTAADLRGLAPGITGGLSSEDYVRGIREAGEPATVPPTADPAALLSLVPRDGLAEALKEYDAGRIEVKPMPGRAVSPGGKPTRFHVAWADALLKHMGLNQDTGSAEPGEGPVE